jgi:hypothetical protein
VRTSGTPGVRCTDPSAVIAFARYRKSGLRGFFALTLLLGIMLVPCGAYFPLDPNEPVAADGSSPPDALAPSNRPHSFVSLDLQDKYEVR